MDATQESTQGHHSAEHTAVTGVHIAPNAAPAPPAATCGAKQQHPRAVPAPVAQWIGRPFADTLLEQEARMHAWAPDECPAGVAA